MIIEVAIDELNEITDELAIGHLAILVQVFKNITKDQHLDFLHQGVYDLDVKSAQKQAHIEYPSVKRMR